MTTDTINRTTGSAYPPAVADLMPRARILARDTGALPSRNKLMTELKIGKPKARTLLDLLAEEGWQAPAARPTRGAERLHLVTPDEHEVPAVPIRRVSPATHDASPVASDTAARDASTEAVRDASRSAGTDASSTPANTTPPVEAPAADRWESRIQTLLTFGTGLIAFGGALGHAVQLAVAHGQPVVYASLTAVLIETTALSATLELRRRRRTGQSIWLPVLVLILGAGLSLSVQIACAEHSVWGWILAAVPVVAFLILMKFALSRLHSDPGPRRP
ncbi:hypothetical protein [Cryptosporangium aurantiacum]|uniref:DUF2637 domain-containing protein n=1 Tax=Cryptosporangium aurantiacum TaxID=134849 RepID=A0A1M7NM59_9ACTN|nr:hypothetical protein [Cryptosporangium aurantiacum]SHN04998.1 hypothetical protein SAMN05443668_102722 [Cryptosporangium aurantiacum]